MAPGARERVNQAIAFPGGFVDIRGRVAGLRHESGILGIGDRRAGDFERRRIMTGAPALAVVPAELLRAVVAVSRFVEHIGGFALRRVRAGDERPGRDGNGFGHTEVLIGERTVRRCRRTGDSEQDRHQQRSYARDHAFHLSAKLIPRTRGEKS